ncbi:MAG: hypothetical protein MZV65_32180 [Chromatiales bacterium]|nr:hypothetical protein [Chromatiales bacterium]
MPWIRRFSVGYHLGVDGISMPLILLTTFMTPFWSSSPAGKSIETRVAQYMAAFLILEGADDRRLRRARRDAVLRVLRRRC